MAKKQFKIGECAVGGIIAVEITKQSVFIKALDYYTKKEVSGNAISISYSDAERFLDNYLNELTTSYYASKIMDWIKTKVKFDQTF